MARWYVDITGIDQSLLDFAGYPCIAEDEDFKILFNKGDIHIIDKKGKQYLYVDDVNDVTLLGAATATREKIALPNDPNKKKSPPPKKGPES
jgi:hypothetical protein